MILIIPFNELPSLELKVTVASPTDTSSGMDRVRMNLPGVLGISIKSKGILLNIVPLLPVRLKETISVSIKPSGGIISNEGIEPTYAIPTFPMNSSVIKGS